MHRVPGGTILYCIKSKFILLHCYNQFVKKMIHLPVWAPRVKPYLIRRLYESDAQGLLDEQLVNEVGWALYSRCDSFLRAKAAQEGQVHCPVCDSSIRHSRQANEVMRCSFCGWECTVRAYLETIKNQQLVGGPEVAALFQEYIDRFPRSKEPAEKMVCIDGLIHGFHHFLTSGRTRRPVGVNLIDGHLEFVVDFLNRLSYGPGSTPGTQETYATWRENINSPLFGKRSVKKKS